MAHYVGKIDFNSLDGTKIMEIDQDGHTEKGVFVPIVPNGIVLWNNEIQLWFRAFAYRSPKSRFSHFIMKFIPKSEIKKLSASQIELFANHSIGGILKSKSSQDMCEKEIGTDYIISKNI